MKPLLSRSSVNKGVIEQEQERAFEPVEMK